MKIIDTSLQDLKLIEFPMSLDDRGNFEKMYHYSSFYNAGIDFKLKESYFSNSKLGVIRGMHFQTPPYQHSKIIVVPKGKIVDVVLDLRKESKTYLQYESFELDAQNHCGLFIPEGFAHGFQAIEDDSLLMYLVSSEYEKTADQGILYNSFGFNWPLQSSFLSERDLSFPSLNNFESPF